ncbi:uncharacterized protein LOC126680373 [Mercurialis annua]|uniref:uncharacterized protein LOC126680373 n=1 Tax=Mercurialis annua TaxID=3986 RepID=UPI0021607F95|nr:uncharacterized protein LOC126680373 [Mercurialis annua]
MQRDSRNENDQELLEGSAPLKKCRTDEGSIPKKDIPAISAQTPFNPPSLFESLKAKYPRYADAFDRVRDETEDLWISEMYVSESMYMFENFASIAELGEAAEQLLRQEKLKYLEAEKVCASLFERYSKQKLALKKATSRASSAEAKYDALRKEHGNLVATLSEYQSCAKTLEAEKQALEEEKKGFLVVLEAEEKALEEEKKGFLVVFEAEKKALEEEKKGFLVVFEAEKKALEEEKKGFLVVLEAEKKAMEEEKKVFLEEKIVIEQGIDAALEESRTISGDRAEMYDEFNAILEAMIEQIRAKAKVFQRQRMALTAKGLMQGMRKSGEN